MSTHSSLDRESFQALLANAYAVQESGMDPHSLSSVLELQRSISTGQSDLDQALQMIADRARNVANASGIAIALLEANQLVYRAGSGTAADYVGRHMTAVLSVSAQKEPRSEILRVENAETDSRIEAAICRQFEATSLLILPIYKDRALAGVLEVLFSDAHRFENREVRTYRLMAGMVEEALVREAHRKQKNVPVSEPATVPHYIEQVASRIQRTREEEVDAPPVPQPVPAWVVAAREASARLRLELPRLLEGAKDSFAFVTPVKAALRSKLRPFENLGWTAGGVAAVIALLIASGIAYHRRPASAVAGSVAKKSNLAAAPVSTAPSNLLVAGPQAQNGAAVRQTKPASSAFKRIRVGQNEVDYIADDVTIRHFMVKPAAPQGHHGAKEVRMGDDVTVRYFAYKPVSSMPQARPVSAAAGSVEAPVAVSK